MDLWKRMASGDDEAVARFCDHYRSRIEFICYKRGVPRHDCPDLAQEVIAAAACQIQNGKFREESNLETWLMGILRNKIADYWRRKSRQVTCISLEVVSDGDGDCHDAAAIVESEAELPIMVHQALATLPEEHRFLLMLSALEGYTAREIAPLVGRSEGRVGALIAEAKAMFRIAIRRSEENPGSKRLNPRDE